ncbi:MAG: YbgC/FadM family acyl-CoA thioesterase [Verrucomicrobia bacterium]|nr:YbgC/FadM family acyl-CoA thioesterase [Deltaproteobacteria bacterium]
MEVRIYYEDTDAAGVVYHANYLKYLERARTEYFRERGLLVAELAAAGHVFPVVRMEVDFMSPARHDDLLSIVTKPVQSSGSSFSLRQQIFRTGDSRLLVNALVKLACIGPNLKARRIPTEVLQLVEVEADTGAE